MLTTVGTGNAAGPPWDCGAADTPWFQVRPGRNPDVTGDDLEIRRFRTGDAEAVRELNETALRDVDAYAEGVTDGDLGTIEETYLAAGEFLVGELDGEVVATGALKPAGDGTFAAERALAPDDGPAAEITRMRVAPAHQRRGYGTRLLRRLEARAIELGYEVLVLDTTARQAGARRLYESFGYEREAAFEWREYEVLLYRKELDG